MDFLKHILCINLEDRKDRLDHVTKEFQKLDIDSSGFERFNAVKTISGHIGCTLSHIKCIEIAKKRDYPFVFVCEDDITFTNPPLFLEKMGDLYRSNMEWDVLIVGGNNCPPFVQITNFAVRAFNIQTTTGYIVKKHYYDVLIDNFKTGVQSLIREPTRKKEFSIDIFWKTLQRSGMWILLIPPTVVQYADYSDIESKMVDYTGAMLDLDKKKLIEHLMRLEEDKKKSKSPLFSMVYNN